MNTATQNKCAHQQCTCPAASNSRYCSPACESGKDRKALAAAVIRIALAPRLLRNDGAVEPVCFGCQGVEGTGRSGNVVGLDWSHTLASSKEASASKSLVLIAFVLAIAALYFGRQVCIPLALALVFSFLLTPFVSLLEKLRFGRVPAVLTVLILSFVWPEPSLGEWPVSW